MRILFMGTPTFAVASLQALLAAGHEVCAAFTQPDRPRNRGMKLQPTPVKELCLERDIPVFQPEKIRDGAAAEIIRSLAPQIIVVAAYGRILPQEILDCPPMGCINVHSSLLPKYRGAAPIHWAILQGERESGVTIMHMAPALDAGDIIAQAATPIDPEETVESLHDRLALLGGELLVKTLADLEAGVARRIPQVETEATYAPMLNRDMSRMDFSRPALALHNQVRSLIPWPAAVAGLGGVRCKILSTRVSSLSTRERGGTVIRADKGGLLVACGEGSVLEILQLQPDGKKPMAATAFLLGKAVAVGSFLE